MNSQSEVDRNSKAPERGLTGPIWCHIHGAKMYLDKESSNSIRVMIKNGLAASLTISPLANPISTYQVEWELGFGPSDKTFGKRRFTTAELEGAFGLRNHTDHGGELMIDRFGGESAVLGKYIRWMGFVNSPCPGTGSDGDPNISIHIDNDIQGAIARIIQANEKPG